MMSNSLKALIVTIFVIFYGLWCVNLGEGRESDRRDALDLRRQELADSAFNSALARGAQSERNYLAAQQKANKLQGRLSERIKNAKNLDLAVANCSPAARFQGSAPSADAPACTVTRYFVSLWNRAWAPGAGAEQPVPGDSAGPTPEERQPTAIGPRDILANEQGNAASCAADRARLDELVDLLGRLEADWDRAHKNGR